MRISDWSSDVCSSDLVVTMVYALGHVSGGHFNPAVTLGLWSAGRFGPARVIPYWIAQVAGAILAAAVLYPVASGKTGFDLAGGFAAHGSGAHSPGGSSLLPAPVKHGSA